MKGGGNYTRPMLRDPMALGMSRGSRWGSDGARRERLTLAMVRGLVAVIALAWMAGWAAPALAQSGRDLASPWAPGRRPSPTLTGPEDALVLTPPSGEAVIPPAPTGAYASAVPPLRDATGLRLPSTISTRLRALEGDLQALAMRGSGYIVDGVVQLLSSGVSIAVGVLFFTSGSAGEGFSAYLFTMGGVGVARGLLTLLVPVTPAESAVSYGHPMPLTSYREARARLRSREGELAGLANAASIGRIIDGSLGVGVGLAMIPIFAVMGFEPTQPLNYVMLLLAGVSTITGVITLFSTSDAERRWNGYVELRDRLQVTAAGSADERWLDEHADSDPDEDLSLFAPEEGPSFEVAVGLGGGSLHVTF